ncbi:GNAT family N-acetyltransferase [Streptomyces sp. NBC_00690]|nr:GNAT family N-acetyltransferase [Streptomyces sp. NBC_00690]
MTETMSAQRTRRPRQWRRSLFGPSAAFAAVTAVLLLTVNGAMTRHATTDPGAMGGADAGRTAGIHGGDLTTRGTSGALGSAPAFPEPSTTAAVTIAVVSTGVLLLWWLGWSRRRSIGRGASPTTTPIIVTRSGSTPSTSGPTAPPGTPPAGPAPSKGATADDTTLDRTEEGSRPGQSGTRREEPSARKPVRTDGQADLRADARENPSADVRKSARTAGSARCVQDIDTGMRLAPSTSDVPDLASPAAGTVPEQPETTLWRMRTTVQDTPGSLAALCTALAGLRVDILTLQTHPLTDGTVDEFLLRAPVALEAQHLTREIARAGGRDIWTERADAHDVVDTPTRVLALAARTAVDSAALPLSLRRLLGRCTIRSRPAVSASGHRARDLPPVEGVLDGTVMRLRDGEGGAITVERPYLAFTPTEFARARALVELDAVLGLRIPRGQDVWTLAEGEEIVVGRAGLSDVSEATALHERCSDRALRQRYHGPVGDAHRYLNHLLDPRFGQTLAARTPSGRMVALGHLLWDGDETEVALLVEDDWQRRGIGAELLRRLLALARETRCRSVYAVTRSSNTGMVSAMRGLGLPLDYQLEEGTLVITARLEVTSTASRSSAALPGAPAGHRGPG